MPEVRDITVHVTSSEGIELPEWGVHTFRRNNKTSAYIQSKTDMPFRVSVTPRVPYIPKDVASAHVYETRKRGSNRPGFFKMEDKWEEDMDIGGDNHRRPENENESRGQSASKQSSPKNHRRSSFGNTPKTRHSKRESRDKNTSFSSPPPSRDFDRIPPPPFHFLASMYLDGRRKAERKVVVYLDPDDEDFNRPDGKVHLKTRWVEGRDGNLRELGWVFKDVGIETVFDKMLLSGDHHVSGKVNMRDEDSIIAAMNAAELGAEGDVKREEKTKLGQIIVTIERIKLGQKWVEDRFQAKHREGDIDDVQMDGASNEITHTAGFGQARALKSKDVRVVAYTPYREGEGVYATFQFFYRSEAVLQKFNFPGFHSTKSAPRDRRYLDAKLANLTPLGISKPLRPMPESGKEKFIPFEETIKKGKSAGKEPAESAFNDADRQNTIRMKVEEWGMDGGNSLLNSVPSFSESISRSPPKTSSRGREKENLKPDNIETCPGFRQYGQRSPRLQKKSDNSSNQLSKSPSIEASQTVGSGIALLLQEPKPLSQGPDISMLGEPTPSSVSLPSTLSQVSLKSPEDGKPSHEVYRKSFFESDADDEASDIETHNGSDEGAVDCGDHKCVGEDKADQELLSALQKIQLGKRSRDSDDHSELGLQLTPPAEELILQMRDPRETERENDIAREMEAQLQDARDVEFVAPAKRRKGFDG